jgi:hypothetical protein
MFPYCLYYFLYHFVLSTLILHTEYILTLFYFICVIHKAGITWISPLRRRNNYLIIFFELTDAETLQEALHTSPPVPQERPCKSRMASGSPAKTPTGKPSQVYACKCLNVHITSSTQAPSSPEGSRDPAYESIFVDDEGIAIVRFLFHKIYWYQAHLLYLSDTSPSNGQNYNARRTNTGYYTTLPIYRFDMPTLSAARIPCISNYLIGHSGQ